VRDCKDACTQETVHDLSVTATRSRRARTHARPHARPHARTHARTPARRHARRHARTHARRHVRVRERRGRASRRADAEEMRLGPIILSWATAAASWLGPASGSATATATTATVTAREPRSRDYELSTEFFLVPSEIGHGLASVASVISVPAPNRTVSVFRTPPGVRKSQEVDMRPASPKSLLKQRPWALPLAALSAAAMLLMAGFEVFVLLKVGVGLYHKCAPRPRTRSRTDPRP